MRPSNVHWKIALVLILLIGAGAWWGWQAYPGLFGQGAQLGEQDSQGVTPVDTLEQSFEATRQAIAERDAELERKIIAESTKVHWPAFDAALDAGDLSEAAGILALVRYLQPRSTGFSAKRAAFG